MDKLPKYQQRLFSEAMNEIINNPEQKTYLASPENYSLTNDENKIDHQHLIALNDPTGAFSKNNETEIHEIEIKKTKKEQSLGIGIVGGVDAPGGPMGIYIKNIYPNGLVMKDGKLQIGNEILAINGKSLLGMSRNEVIAQFQAVQEAIIMLTVKSNISMNAESFRSTLISQKPVKPPRPNKNFKSERRESIEPNQLLVSHCNEIIETKDTEHELKNSFDADNAFSLPPVETYNFNSENNFINNPNEFINKEYINDLQYIDKSKNISNFNCENEKKDYIKNEIHDYNMQINQTKNQHELPMIKKKPNIEYISYNDLKKNNNIDDNHFHAINNNIENNNNNKIINNNNYNNIEFQIWSSFDENINSGFLKEEKFDTKTKLNQNLCPPPLPLILPHLDLVNKHINDINLVGENLIEIPVELKEKFDNICEAPFQKIQQQGDNLISNCDYGNSYNIKSKKKNREIHGDGSHILPSLPFTLSPVILEKETENIYIKNIHKDDYEENPLIDSLKVKSLSKNSDIFYKNEDISLTKETVLILDKDCNNNLINKTTINFNHPEFTFNNSIKEDYKNSEINNYLSNTSIENSIKKINKDNEIKEENLNFIEGYINHKEEKKCDIEVTTKKEGSILNEINIFDNLLKDNSNVNIQNKSNKNKEKNSDNIVDSSSTNIEMSNTFNAFNQIDGNKGLNKKSVSVYSVDNSLSSIVTNSNGSASRDFHSYLRLLHSSQKFGFLKNTNSMQKEQDDSILLNLINPTSLQLDVKQSLEEYDVDNLHNFEIIPKYNKREGRETSDYSIEPTYIINFDDNLSISSKSYLTDNHENLQINELNRLDELEKKASDMKEVNQSAFFDLDNTYKNMDISNKYEIDINYINNNLNNQNIISINTENTKSLKPFSDKLDFTENQVYDNENDLIITEKKNISPSIIENLKTKPTLISQMYTNSLKQIDKDDKIKNVLKDYFLNEKIIEQEEPIVVSPIKKTPKIIMAQALLPKFKRGSLVTNETIGEFFENHSNKELPGKINSSINYNKVLNENDVSNNTMNCMNNKIKYTEQKHKPIFISNTQNTKDILDYCKSSDLSNNFPLQNNFNNSSELNLSKTFLSRKTDCLKMFTPNVVGFTDKQIKQNLENLKKGNYCRMSIDIQTNNDSKDEKNKNDTKKNKLFSESQVNSKYNLPTKNEYQIKMDGIDFNKDDIYQNEHALAFKKIISEPGKYDKNSGKYDKNGEKYKNGEKHEKLNTLQTKNIPINLNEEFKTIIYESPINKDQTKSLFECNFIQYKTNFPSFKSENVSTKISESNFLNLNEITVKTNLNLINYEETFENQNLSIESKKTDLNDMKAFFEEKSRKLQASTKPFNIRPSIKKSMSLQIKSGKLNSYKESIINAQQVNSNETKKVNSQNSDTLLIEEEISEENKSFDSIISKYQSLALNSSDKIKIEDLSTKNLTKKPIGEKSILTNEKFNFEKAALFKKLPGRNLSNLN